MNVLILSAGTRNKLIQYFQQNIDGNIVAADMLENAPAIYDADKYYIVPRASDPKYIDKIFEICKTEKIDAVISLIDPELSVLAAHAEELENLGATFIGSRYELCETALNKMKKYDWLEQHGYNCVKKYDDKTSFYEDLERGEIAFPVFVKPISGSASIAANIIEDKSTLELIWQCNQGLMIQELMQGQEIGADIYVDLVSNEVVSIFTKKKLRMRAGETDKSVSFKDPKLFDLLEQFVIEFGLKGCIDIDLFEIDGEYYINDINPRFGGGYPHAHECGCNFIKMIENNINGIANMKNIGNYEDGIYMMKYSEVMIRKI